MQRYFVPTENWRNDTVVIEGDDAHHMLRVMRMQVDDRIICNPPASKGAICKIVQMDTDSVTAKVVEWLDRDSELPVYVTIAQGLPKGDKMDLVLQKGTELGASAFIPFQADRSVVKWDAKKEEKKLTRYRKIIKEASEQSHRNHLPEIKPAMKLKQFIEESNTYHVRLFAYEEEAKTASFQSFASVVSKLNKGERVMICIGPEGGFSTDEVDTLKEHNFIPVRLGPRILRTETAALYALASISYHLEELED
ncbi:16S rRNA (uracil(1498)-N(3))-methyltransferase [Ornithinibacillus massiliensis]|uniref:Ribosomal RNA small subunit methyltransferase E n=1 Tax=Ornithinibacillus massiliensis TaxID=1944633 RepID=A0ABS5MBK6_9BACI|nr:16S rRNA (uracil(1498)-N(3))-methyltransferase [Ornithinibacillus massiliensis]MBS3679535.1 16S rRNA (uracil(1498)-N(3))-methyltransferase [Ornithinibacillus massiliensis]